MASMGSTITKNDSKNALTAPSPRENGSEATESMLKDEERTRCEIWTRCMGYHRPVSYFNIGKKQEFADRKYFKEPKELLCSILE